MALLKKKVPRKGVFLVVGILVISGLIAAGFMANQASAWPTGPKSTTTTAPATTSTTTPPATDEKLTVLNPLGTTQPYEVFSMAARPDSRSLAGKTVYIVCTGFCSPLHDVLPAELAKKYPDTTWKAVNKYGTYFEDDPDLWDEIEANAAGAILHTGH